ncbi:hypothetical protein ACHQM5_023721 [Ranunculus cassubicifolius]
MAVSLVTCANKGRNLSNTAEADGGIYVAAIPLRAAKGPGQFIMSTAYSLNLCWDFQHFMVLISSPQHQSQVLVFDYQPQDPENIYVALAALSGGKVPGAIRVRKMTMLPKNKCWHVGFSSKDSIVRAEQFNEAWQSDLKIGQHDCRDYTNGLVEHLTGEKQVLNRLRRDLDI